MCVLCLAKTRSVTWSKIEVGGLALSDQDFFLVSLDLWLLIQKYALSITDRVRIYYFTNIYIYTNIHFICIRRQVCSHYDVNPGGLIYILAEGMLLASDGPYFCLGQPPYLCAYEQCNLYTSGCDTKNKIHSNIKYVCTWYMNFYTPLPPLKKKSMGGE
jgi:hypothetical protein